MTEYIGSYKWSYDPRRRSLAIWAVDSTRRYASPSHHDMTGDDGLLNCSQGRLVIENGQARGVIYLSRPIDPTYLDRVPVHTVAKNEVEDEIGLSIVWREEE